MAGIWLKKDFLLDEFSEYTKQGTYNRIGYDVWRNLKKASDNWNLNLEYPTVIVSWEGCIAPYEFKVDDKSIGEYLYNILNEYQGIECKCSANTSNLSSALERVGKAAEKAAASIASIDTTAIKNAWSQTSNSITADYYTGTYGTGLTISDQYGDWYTASDSTGYTNKTTPDLHISQDGLYIGGKKLDDIIDEATGASVKRKEKDTMDLFKGFEFGSCENDKVKVSMYGIAVQNATGTWVSYDPNSGKVIDVDILNFNGKYLYKMPVAIKDVKESDVIIHNRKPMFVTAVDGGKLLVIDPAAGEEKIVLPTTNMFGFNFAVKIVNLFGDCFGSASADQPFGNMLPLMVLADGGKTDDVLPLMFLMNGGNFDMSNPMMLYFLMKDGKANDMLPLMFFANGTGTAFGKHACDCECDREG